MALWTNAGTYVFAGVALIGSACAEAIPEPLPAPGVRMSSMSVSSGNFAPRATLPVDESCDGKDGSPSLRWSEPPPGTKSLAIVVDDLDSVPSGFTQWLLYDLPPDTLKIAEGFEPDEAQGKVGVNDFKNARYNGPCPPKQTLHRYRFRVIALDAPTGLRDGATRAQFSAAVNGHLIGEGTLKGDFAH